jgi:hypothetical protein
MGAWFAGGMPTLAVLVGILINRYDIGRLDRRLESIEKDLKEFYAIQRVHENRLDTLEKK